jgi:hypothetical protein
MVTVPPERSSVRRWADSATGPERRQHTGKTGRNGGDGAASADNGVRTAAGSVR